MIMCYVECFFFFSKLQEELTAFVMLLFLSLEEK